MVDNYSYKLKIEILAIRFCIEVMDYKLIWFTFVIIFCNRMLQLWYVICLMKSWVKYCSKLQSLMIISIQECWSTSVLVRVMCMYVCEWRWWGKWTLVCGGPWTESLVDTEIESCATSGVRWRPEVRSRTLGSCHWCAQWPLRLTTPRHDPYAPAPLTPAAAPPALVPSSPAASRTCYGWRYARWCPTARSLPLRARVVPAVSWTSLRSPRSAPAPRVWTTALARPPRTARPPTASTTPSSRRVSLMYTLHWVVI